MRRLLFVTALALGVTVGQADNGSFYFGAGITSNKLNDIVLQGNDFPNIDSTSWKVFAGFRPISLFAVEADLDRRPKHHRCSFSTPQSPPITAFMASSSEVP
jgi:hypothetical protein